MRDLTDSAKGFDRGQPAPQRVRQVSGRAKELRTKMFLLGTLPGELSHCLTKIKKQLVAAGARADNLPARDDERAAFAASLNEKAAAYVRTWFTENATFELHPFAADAVRELTEGQVSSGQSGDGQKLWRAVLADYCTTGGEQVADFLNAQGAGLVPAESSVFQPADDSGSGLSTPLPLVAPASPRSANHSAEQVFWPASRQEILLESEDECLVLGQRANVLDNGTIFVHILAIYAGTSLIGLKNDLAAEFFPERGDAIAYRNALHVDEQVEGSLAVWRVVRKANSKSAHFTASAFDSIAYEIQDVPYGSGDPDNVRQWIKEVYRQRPHTFPIFHLRDGLYIKLPADTCDPRAGNFDSPLYGYKSLRCFVWQGRLITVGQLPQPDLKYDCAPPRTVVKRLLSHPGARTAVPGLTNAQIAQIADAAGRASLGKLDAAAIGRAQRYLSECAADDALASEAVAEILQLPAVVHIIESARADAVRAAGELGDAARSELSKLAAEKKQLQADIEKARQSASKEAAAVAREVRQAFERAGADGMKTLASIALFKNILGPIGGEGGSRPQSMPGQKQAALRMEGIALPAAVAAKPPALIASAKDAKRIFSRWDVQRGISPQMLFTAMGACAAAGIVALCGSSSSELAAAMARCLSGGAHASISVSGDMFGLGDLLNASAAACVGGSSQALMLGDLVERCQVTGEPLVIRLKGANRMPPEAYLPDLLAACRSDDALSWSDRKGAARAVWLKSPVIFIAEFSHGRSVFPIVPPLCWDVPLIDTDAPWPDISSSVPEDAYPDPAAIDPGFFRAMQRPGEVLWRAPAALPRNGRRLAERMVNACVAAGLPMREAASPVLLAVVLGRLSGQAITDTLHNGGGSHAAEFSVHARSSNVDNIFDMGNPQ